MRDPDALLPMPTPAEQLDQIRMLARAAERDAVRRQREQDDKNPLLLRAVSDLPKTSLKAYSLCRLLERKCKAIESQKYYLEAYPETPRDKFGRIHPADRPAEPEAPADCLESELSAAIAREIGISNFGGSYVPLRLRASGLDTKTDAAGGYTIAAGVPDLVECLRAQARVFELGAELMPLRGSPTFPVTVNVTAAQWVGENPGSDVSQSDASFAGIRPRPRMLSATTSVSRTLLASGSPQVEAWLRAHLMLAHATALDAGAVNGSGTSNEVIGLLHLPDVGSVSIAAVPTALKAAEMERIVGVAGADYSSNRWLTTSRMREVLRKIPRMSSGTTPLLDDAGRMLGYELSVSENVPSNLGASENAHGIIFGSWRELKVGEWGALEILVDPYSQKKRGEVEITSYLLADVFVLRPGAFCVCVDATLA